MTQDSNGAPDYAGHSGAHTPGPWFVDGHRVYGPSRDGKCYVLASTAFFYDQEGANARLIAAAPELLAACHEAAAMLEHLGVIGSLPDELNAAIAKAEGRQS